MVISIYGYQSFVTNANDESSLTILFVKLKTKKGTYLRRKKKVNPLNDLPLKLKTKEIHIYLFARINKSYKSFYSSNFGMWYDTID